jgi:hypothetical protein
MIGWYRGRHVRPRKHRVGILMASVLSVLACMVMLAQPARASAESPGARALDWAEAHATGNWYVWGGTGPGYDCSGLVMVSLLRAAGISLPHSTYSMLASGHLHRIPVSQAQRGDLLFYGSGHVEFKTRWHHVSFGAHNSGERIGWQHWNGWWQPTMAFRVW